MQEDMREVAGAAGGKGLFASQVMAAGWDSPGKVHLVVPCRRPYSLLAMRAAVSQPDYLACYLPDLALSRLS
jgi:hypothetical protein